MISLQTFEEIFISIRKNKLRSVLTGFSVAWGIFMLVVLLGNGEGLKKGIQSQFTDAMYNSLWVFGGQTSMEYDGFKSGRPVMLKNEDYDLVKELDDIGISSSRYSIPGENILSYGSEYGLFEIRTSLPAYDKIEYIETLEGRFLNQRDIDDFRKVAVISTEVRDFLFKKEDPMGKYVQANGVNFLIVGVFQDIDRWDNNKCIYVPVSTAQRVFAGGDRISMMSLTIDNGDMPKSLEIMDKIKGIMARKYHFNPTDERAMYISNNMERYENQMSMVNGISIFIWIVGIGTIIAGIVGISNIMMIAVNDRTREIGIRKAIGAKSISIVSMVLLESVVITAIAGYIGLFGGVAILELLKDLLTNDIFKEPEANMSIALYATVLLIVAGAGAGYFPARRAARIKPVEALKYE